jgi:alkaline phosphatase D
VTSPTKCFNVAFCLSLIVTLALQSQSKSQVIPDYDLGGASKPKVWLNFFEEDKYKRVHQSSLRLILHGQLDATEKFLTKFAQRFPEDAESLYMLGILHGQRGDVGLVEDFMKRAIAAGLPEGRMVAGPRAVMKPLADSALMKALVEKFSGTALVHGPLVGNVTATSASFWVRTAVESDLEVVATTAGGQRRSAKVRSKSAEDFTAVISVDGLVPETEYTYSVIQDGIEVEVREQSVQTFQTFAQQTQPSKFRIAFGGGAGYVPQNERMWDTIGSFDPNAILLLGDNVYIDDPESVAMQQYTYHRRQSRPEWKNLTARCPVYTIWDDHDFSDNDSWGGKDIDIPFWKKDFVFPIFRQNWANPGYGGGEERPGCWYSFQIGDVDFMMLDCRYYRTTPKVEDGKSMLGAVQKAWLKKQLRDSAATFKVICSSVPWDFRTKGGSLDTWNGYRAEHEEILGFVDENKIEGVVLMSADRHRSDCWKLSRPDGYDLYDFNSSRLTNQHVHPTMENKGAIFSYNELQSFSLVTFDTTVDDPTVEYEVVNIDGEKPHAITVKRSQLKRSIAK